MNVYLDHVIEKTIASKLKDFTSSTSHTVKKCSLSSAALVGTPSIRHESKTKPVYKNAFLL